MSVFKSHEEFKEVFDPFMRDLISHPVIGRKLARSRIIVQFAFSDPSDAITFNFREPPADPKQHGSYVWGKTAWAPDVAFQLTADFANRFWQGKENIVTALAKKQVTVRGSIPKALQLFPAMRSSFKIYRALIERLGKVHLLARD